MKTIIAAAVLAVTLGEAGFGQAQSGAPDHPQFLMGDYGYEWVAASRIVNEDGSLNREFASEWFVDGLEYQKEWGCQPMMFVSYPWPSESRGYFSSTLLLSAVAVSAKLGEAVPGFGPSGDPKLLFSLSHVVPLRDRTPLPDYVLVPVNRMVVDDRLFCAISDSESWPSRTPLPEAGSELVVLGGWAPDSVVRLGTHRHTGAIGVVGEDGESLAWNFSASESGPETVAEMRRHIDDATASGLLDATRHLTLERHGSPDRMHLSGRVVELHDLGCRVDSVEQSDGSLALLHSCADDQ